MTNGHLTTEESSAGHLALVGVGGARVSHGRQQVMKLCVKLQKLEGGEDSNAKLKERQLSLDFFMI